MLASAVETTTMPTLQASSDDAVQAALAKAMHTLQSKSKEILTVQVLTGRFMRRSLHI